MHNSGKILLLILIISIWQLTSFAQNQPSAREESRLIKNMARGADVIVAGKVADKKSEWNKNKTRIYTKATVRVDEYLKGTNNNDFVEIRYPGGEVDGVGELYTHMPTFEHNEEVLVFLKKEDKSPEYRVFNGNEGKLTVIRDTESKQVDLRIEVIKKQIKDVLGTQR